VLLGLLGGCVGWCVDVTGAGPIRRELGPLLKKGCSQVVATAYLSIHVPRPNVFRGDFLAKVNECF